ncbi:MAG: Gfo/Idh/MocA family protein [Planctomycetaceae bacterium]
MTQIRIPRRQFLAHAAAAFAAPAILHAAVRRQEFHVACVGVNGMGWADLSSVGTHPKVKFVGFCDIDASRFDKVDANFPGVKHFSDYRKMFAELGDKVDAVIVSTPDHMHAPVAMEAMKLGKHVYCQKPLTHTVWESRQMQLMAEKMGVTTQMGNQIHSNAEYRRGVQLIHDGAIGKVQEVHSWVGVQGRQYNSRTDRPPEAPVPAGVEWDLWIGAAPMRPFSPDVYHPFKWRDWQDFGSGALGDFGCHILDPVFGALEITSPLSIKAENDGTTNEVWPGPETVTFEFPGTDHTAGDTIRIIWRDGGLKPPRELAQLPDGVDLPGAGSLFIGEEGTMILPHVGFPQLYPQEKFVDYKIPEIEGVSHWHTWVDAAIAGEKTSDGFHYAGPLSETVQLGNVAARLPGVDLEWDAAELKFTNSPEADKLVSKRYRKGFEVHCVE